MCRLKLSELFQVAARWPALVNCAEQKERRGGVEVVEDIGLKVEREALHEGGDGKVEEEEGGGGKSEIGVDIQENATGRGAEKLGRQKATEIEKAGGQSALKGGGGVEHNALKGEGNAEQSALRGHGEEAEQSALRGGEEGEQSALRGGGEESREGGAALVLAAALCYHLLL